VFVKRSSHAGFRISVSNVKVFAFPFCLSILMMNPGTNLEPAGPQGAQTMFAIIFL